MNLWNCITSSDLVGAYELAMSIFIFSRYSYRIPNVITVKRNIFKFYIYCVDVLALNIVTEFLTSLLSKEIFSNSISIVLMFWR